MTTKHHPSATAQKIIAAAVDRFGEVGWAQASTKSIAQRAGVNELTVFRLFGSKKGLLEQTLQHTLQPLIAYSADNGVPTSASLEASLTALARLYREDIGRHASFMLRIMAEAKNSDIADVLLPYQTTIIESLRSLFNANQAARHSDVSTDELITLFMGPLFLQIALNHLDLSLTLSAEDYVSQFMQAHNLHTHLS